MSNKYLTIGFSILREDFSKVRQSLKDLSGLISQRNISANVDLIVVVQASDGSALEDIAGVRYIHTEETGLSKSRNTVVCYSLGNYIWFLDADTYITEKQLMEVVEQIAHSAADLLIGKIYCSDYDGFYKKYSARDSSSFWPVKCSSIEIIVSREFLSRSGIRFDERFGLGAQWPSCEETIFLLDCKDRGAITRFLGHDVVSHPCFDNARRERIKAHLESIVFSKAYVCRRVGGGRGALLGIYWAVKFAVKYRNFLVPIWLAKSFVNCSQSKLPLTVDRS